MVDMVNRCVVIEGKVIKFSEITIIKEFYFRFEHDEFWDEHFNADISFIATQKDSNTSLKIKFYDVNSLKMNRTNHQIMGFDILDRKDKGYTGAVRYHFEDYEDGVMDFYCSAIELIE